MNLIKILCRAIAGVSFLICFQMAVNHRIYCIFFRFYIYVHETLGCFTTWNHLWKLFHFLHFSNWISFLGFNNSMWSCYYNLYYTGNCEFCVEPSVRNPLFKNTYPSVLKYVIFFYFQTLGWHESCDMDRCFPSCCHVHGNDGYCDTGMSKIVVSGSLGTFICMSAVYMLRIELHSHTQASNCQIDLTVSNSVHLDCMLFGFSWISRH